jgi:glycerophosphoryl diester phosphodiesterase
MLVRMQLAPILLICGLSLVGGAVAGGDVPEPFSDRPTTIEEFLTMRTRPIVIAHRGFSAEAPENTLASVRAAIAAGADMIEVDVTLTADGEVVVIHDDTLDRTTDGSGLVVAHSLEQLLRLDAGAWFARRFRGERIPTLAQVLDEVRGRILINVEIKPEAVGERTEGGIAERVVRLIEERDMRDQVIVSSFEPRALLQIDEVDPELATASLYNKDLHLDMDPLAIVGAVGSRALNLSQDRVTPAIVERCRQNQVQVGMRRLIRMDVDAIFTDRPDRLIEVLREELGPTQDRWSYPPTLE